MIKRSWAEPYKIKMVEHLRMTTPMQREQAIAEAGFNTFLLRSEDVYIDLLTDSGTSAMSDRQWAGLMMGDEAYAGSANYYRFERAVQRYYGYRNVIPTHQGRGAEHILSKLLIKPGDVVPGNMYFTTTRAHQELAGGRFVDVIGDAAHDPDDLSPFKGNIDIERLLGLIERVGAARIPYVCMQCSVNMAGGQPVSLANMQAVSALCRSHGIKVMLDATRAVENAYFIRQREPGHSQRSIEEILREMCSYTDGCTNSAKKDCLVNIGGFLCLNDDALAEEAGNMVVLYEGLHTYGGLAGRDMEAMAIGIEESVQFDHIRARVGQVEYLGNLLMRAGVPIVKPIGGHGIFINALKFLPHIPREEFPAQALACALYVDSGVRAMERGAVSSGRDPDTGANIFPKLELVRLTIPRRVYTQAHLDVTAESIIELLDHSEEVVGLRFTYEPKHLRFFQARFEPVQGSRVRSARVASAAGAV
ncbi:MAG: tyrosine phenol-lyase [Phycisphaerales bacterium]